MATVKDIDRGMKKIMRQFKSRQAYTVVGWFGNGGDPSQDLASRALVLEMGTTIGVTDKMRGYLHSQGFHLSKGTTQITIPPRPLMKQSVDNARQQIERVKLAQMRSVTAGKLTMRQALSRIGEYFTGVVKKTMTTGNFVKNHPFTIQRKGSTRPLINSGRLRNAVEHKERIK